jgi:excisionase family DNA binding protein
VGHKEEPNTPEQLQLAFGSTFLDIDQVAAMMRVPKSFIYRRTAKGHDDPIPNYRLGRHLRFKLEDVEAWIENHRNETQPESPAALVAAVRRSARGRSTEALRARGRPGANAEGD